MSTRPSIAGLGIAVMLAAIWFAFSRADAAPHAPPPVQPAPSPTDAAATAPPVEAPMAPVPSRSIDDPAPHLERQEAPMPAGRPQSRVVTGRVLFATGLPAAGAGVGVAKRRMTVDGSGAFRIECEDDGGALVATLAGYEPAVVEAVASRPEVAAGRPLVVVLPGPALSIRGWLVDANGAPCKDWHIDLHGGATPSGHDGLPRCSAEDFAAGASERSFEEWGRAGTAVANPNDQRVAEDGAFVVGGLRRGRDYVLRARNESTLQTVLSPPIAAGTQGYRFVVPAGEWRDRVFGRAIDRHGGPIAKVNVRLTMRVHKSGSGESYQTGQEVQTDAEGRFEFHRVPREDLLLRFNASDVESKYDEFRANDAGEDLVIVLACQCRFRFEPVANLQAPTSLCVLDAAVAALRLERQVGEGRSEGGQHLSFAAGDDAREIGVSDTATWLVLEVDGREIRRLPLLLRRGETTVVRG